MDATVSKLPLITLRHLLIDGNKCIGLQFFPSKRIQLFIKTLNNPRWATVYQMVFVLNTPANVEQIFKTFKGEAWINCRYFFKNKPLHTQALPTDLQPIAKKNESRLALGECACPKEYIQLLETRRYSLNTAKTYTSLFANFIKHHEGKTLIEINEFDIRDYVHGIVKQGKSASYQNQVINAIKFYYEQVLDMPQRFYEIDRPRKTRKLPMVLSEEEVTRLLSVTANLKHKSILVMLYSCGLRLSELLNLKITDIQSDRHLLLVRDAKGGKDRTTFLVKLRFNYCAGITLHISRRSTCLKGRVEVSIAVLVCSIYCNIAWCRRKLRSRPHLIRCAILSLLICWKMEQICDTFSLCWGTARLRLPNCILISPRVV